MSRFAPERVLPALLGGLLLVSCEVNEVTADVSSLSVPVLVGPVKRLGGKADDQRPGKCVATVEAGASYRQTMTDSTQGYGQYQIQQTNIRTSRSDNLESVLSGACADLHEGCVWITSIKATAWTHISLVAVDLTSVTLGADVVDMTKSATDDSSVAEGVRK